MSQQTSVSTIKNETDHFAYPAVTFCVKFKDGAKIVPDMIQQGKIKCYHIRFDLFSFWKLVNYLQRIYYTVPDINGYLVYS